MKKKKKKKKSREIKTFEDGWDKIKNYEISLHLIWNKLKLSIKIKEFSAKWTDPGLPRH